MGSTGYLSIVPKCMKVVRSTLCPCRLSTCLDNAMTDRMNFLFSVVGASGNDVGIGGGSDERVTLVGLFNVTVLTDNQSAGDDSSSTGAQRFRCGSVQDYARRATWWIYAVPVRATGPRAEWNRPLGGMFHGTAARSRSRDGGQTGGLSLFPVRPAVRVPY